LKSKGAKERAPHKEIPSQKSHGIGGYAEFSIEINQEHNFQQEKSIGRTSGVAKSITFLNSVQPR